VPAYAAYSLTSFVSSCAWVVVIAHSSDSSTCGGAEKVASISFSELCKTSCTQDLKPTAMPTCTWNTSVYVEYRTVRVTQLLLRQTHVSLNQILAVTALCRNDNGNAFYRWNEGALEVKASW